MKKTLYFVLIALLLVHVRCKPQADYVVVDKAEVETEELDFAKNLSNKILIAQKNGGYYSLSENEATSQMIEGLNESLQKDSYKKIKSLFGDYKDLEYESLWMNKSGEAYKIYRFKGAFDSGADIEVRTVFNNKGQLAGFYIKPWNDKL